MRRIKVLSLFLSAIVLCAGSISAGQQEQWLQYRSAREAERIVGDIDSRGLDLSSDKPADVELPEFSGQSPLFAKWISPMVKKGYLWIALDRAHKYGPYDRLFIDSDGDGNLNDETATTAYQIEQDGGKFGSAKVIYEGEDGPVTYHLHFEFYRRDGSWGLRVSSGGWYEGAITVGGVKKHCTLIDQNANGTFDDKSKDFDDSDRIRIGDKDERDTKFVGNYIQVDGVLYQPEIARDGAYIRITKAENVTFGNIRVQEAITEFSAGGENGLLDVLPKAGIGRLPVGEYRICGWQIERKDEKDNTWKLEGTRFDEKGNFNVAETSETTLTIGEPVIATVGARKKGRVHSFSQEMRGRLGERIRIARNGAQVRPPKLHIKSADGKYERTFSFEYG